MAISPLSVTRFRVIFSVSWLIIIADHIFLLRWFGLSWQTAIVDSAINDVLLILMHACDHDASLLLPQKKVFSSCYLVHFNYGDCYLITKLF
jgi:hypothetical protein